MENQTPSQNPNSVSKFSFFQSNTAKMIMVGILSLFLLIPLNLVQSLIRERSQRKNEVTKEITQLWGNDILFYGPILKVPYKTYSETAVVDDKTKVTTIQKQAHLEYAYFFPSELNNKTNIEKVDQLKRSLYNPIVFKANIKFNGTFQDVSFDKISVNEEDVLWDKATILIKTTNLKSIKSDLKININTNDYSLESKSDEDNYFGTLETNSFVYKSNEKLTFSFEMNYNGSNSLQFIPVGKTTTTSIDANWDSPSFIGNFAASDTTKKVTTKNFHADWKILHINRPFSQQYTEKIPNLKGYSYGVKLIEPVDEYQQNERASKYGFLVIGLTFLIFFLIQTISKKSIHIFQYTMIGLALIMFYTLLISITEHSSFTIAYIIASSAVIIMLLLYSFSVLKEKKFPFFISISLLILYSFIFVIIQLENYALLVGSIGLFFILGAVMYFSRKIDWNTN
ncbi:membrane protein [Flavobacterium sp. 316]|uniref:Cell envelope integrity protein CreD n=1 Tax=Flavobacterium sediminilitoris TaxID=2024526 RepID=A0ABY4HKS2_9FLAO|nr:MULTISPECIES: cell envelope integrity protein CreD [Flavobacterium]KIX20312.1 membrane protein [Flavobacterium sp. 316]UOX33465.1 cell envelope integrity protein CreD [Flavobacterium sediminilitoris]